MGFYLNKNFILTIMTSLVQYVVVRADLRSTLQWPLGALIAQACHACTAVFSLYRDDGNVLEYTADLDNMHKVVLQCKDEKSLRQLAEKLSQEGIHHKMWIEQPEDIATCVAVKPYKKEMVQKYFKKFKLMK